MTRLLCVVLVVVGACVPMSSIGPFVKRVARTDQVLTVEYCEIVLEGGKLREGACRLQTIPLALPPPPSAAPPPPAPSGAVPSPPAQPPS